MFDKALNQYLITNNNGLIAFFDTQKSVKEGFEKFFEIPLDAAICENGIKGCFVVNTITEMLPKDEVLQIVLENRVYFFVNF